MFNSDTAGETQAGPAVHSVVQVADCLGAARTGLSNRDLLAYVRIGDEGSDVGDGGNKGGQPVDSSLTAASLQMLLRQQMPALFADTEVATILHQHRWRGACSISPVGPVTAGLRAAGQRQNVWFAGDVFGGFPYHMEHACESGHRAAQELMQALQPVSA